MGKRMVRVKSRNMYKGPMDKDNRQGGGLNVGEVGRGMQGRGEQLGEKWGQL